MERRSVKRILKHSAKLVWRILVLIVGLVLLLAGIIMIVTPGPAVVFIPLGLGVLATEFRWARKLLHRVRPMIDAAIAKAKQAKAFKRKTGQAPNGTKIENATRSMGTS
jgi:uncharacterized protein (TIGR02611 family)